MKVPVVPVVLVVAVARNGVIGADNGLPWRLSSDLKRFKALTMGQPIIMGRKTFQSIGKPLPGRETIVVTRNAYADFGPGIHVTTSLDEALDRGQVLAREMRAKSIAVIGGGEIYAQAMAYADRLEMTEVDASPVGDARFPAVDETIWREVSREPHSAGEKDDHAFTFVTLTRR
ncbi:dihydrofolate reductase [Agaricicola taiwanensis]|uniref:Dihydrofolate reductase n=1 Tax=Agaricicola taiwanensis TaxID=591372 RepID=A0A8J2YGY9_9RHOB|nr:dihydrofolate reductase [Agaricicola taiwanensis]GGE42559.1 dihydrofolate reductase [Agaricicola taiwanensis]